MIMLIIGVILLNLAYIYFGLFRRVKYDEEFEVTAALKLRVLYSITVLYIKYNLPFLINYLIIGIFLKTVCNVCPNELYLYAFICGITLFVIDVGKGVDIII